MPRAKRDGIPKSRLDMVLESLATSTNSYGAPRKYKDLLLGRFALEVVMVVRRKYLDDIPHLWGDFTSETVITLIDECQMDGAHQTSSTLVRTIRAINEMYDQKQEIEEVRDTDMPPVILPEQTGNTVILKTEEGNVLETIIEDDLGQQFSQEDEEHIAMHEKAMNSNYDVWREVYHQLATESDPINKAKLKSRLAEIIKDICTDLNAIIEYYSRTGIESIKNYRPYESLCCQDRLKDGEV